MPAGVKPANCVGKKGKSGRKTRLEEIAGIKHRLIEEATTEALTKLARSQVYKALDNEGLSFAQIKEMGLPIALKSITDKVEITDKRILLDE